MYSLAIKAQHIQILKETMFNKKKHSWYWSTFLILMFCLILFNIAKFFMRAINKFDNVKKKDRKKGKSDIEPLFI